MVLNTQNGTHYYSNWLIVTDRDRTWASLGRSPFAKSVNSFLSAILGLGVEVWDLTLLTLFPTQRCNLPEHAEPCSWGEAWNKLEAHMWCTLKRTHDTCVMCVSNEETVSCRPPRRALICMIRIVPYVQRTAYGQTRTQRTRRGSGLIRTLGLGFCLLWFVNVGRM